MSRPYPSWTCSFALTAALVGGVAPPAKAVDPVDDFQNGPFSFTSSAAYQEHVVPIPNPTGHAMHTARKIILSPQGGLPVHAAQADGATFDDRILHVEVAGEGTVRVLWEWGTPRDLTGAGAVDRIEVVLESAPAGALVTGILLDGSVGEGISRTTSGGPEVLSFPLASWTIADAEHATTLGFRFHEADAPYRVSEIRFRRPNSLNIELLGEFVLTEVPPYPGPALRYTAFDPTLDPLYEAAITLRAADSDPPRLDASWHRVSGPAGDRAVTEFRWNEGGFFPFFLTLSFDFLSVGGATPEVYPPDPILEERSLTMRFPVRLVNGGVASGASNTVLTLDVDPRQGAIFQSAVVTPRGAMRGGMWVSGFDLTFDYTFVEGVDEIWPLFHATWVADWNPTMATGAPVAAVGASSLGANTLTAQPSVTRGGATIVAARPFFPGARLTVHDVAGRSVRSMVAPEGARSLRWEGSDESGRTLPAGVYFLRLTEPGTSEALTRVTRVK